MNRYRFCGFPIGVRLEPILAARVCKIIAIAEYLVKPHSENTDNVIGTKAISATSFVMNIDVKKQMNTSRNVSALRLFMPEANFTDIAESTPSRSIPFSETIRQNRQSNVLKSMYFM
jgi:hypothetical protein